MHITYGDFGIRIEMKDTFGKRPGLYVESKNYSLKVGNFASEEKAEIFENYLKYMFGYIGSKDLWKGYENDTE